MSVLNIQADLTFIAKITEILTIAGVTSTITPTFLATQRKHLDNGLSTGGTVAGKCDLWWAKSGRVLASSASETWTLSALTDDALRSIPFVRIRFLLMLVTSSTGNDFFTAGAAGTHPWTAPFSGTTPAEIVRGLWFKMDDSPAALVVTSGSSDQLKITNSGSASMTYSIILGGNSD